MMAVDITSRLFTIIVRQFRLRNITIARDGVME